MKLRLPTRPLLRLTNHYRPVSGYTLYSRHFSCIFIRQPHLPRCKLRLTDPQSSRQRRILIFYMHLLPHRTRPVLRLLPLQRGMNRGGGSSFINHGNSICRLCPPLRANIFLRSHCNHQPAIGYPLRRGHPSPVNLRGIFS